MNSNLSGKRTFKVDGKILIANIKVLPPRSDFITPYEQAVATNPLDQIFICRPEPQWVFVGPGYRVRPTTIGNLGIEVDASSRELWCVPDAKMLGTLDLIERHLRAPRLRTDPTKDDHPVFPSAKIVSFLSSIDGEDCLRLFSVMPSAIQLKVKSGIDIKALVNEVMTFTRAEFGSYCSKKVFGQCRRYYLETGVVEIGYVGTEEDA